MTEIVLASASPRRIELVRRVGLSGCIVDPPDIDESAVEQSPEAAAILSLRKAEAVSARYKPEMVIIAADTLVVCGGAVLGKPKDEGDAYSMLQTLSGRAHTVYTGVTVLQNGRALTQTEATTVHMRTLTESQISAYIATGEPMDKAGGYGIQDRGAMLVERIEGDFYNVMGLPVCLLSKMLESYGIVLL